jgi:uncharacterized protein YodC (DUF2158 family)
MSFNVGDVVKLRSGGPLMTTTGTSVGPDRPMLFTCEWFDRDGHLQHGSFPADALVKPDTALKPVPVRPTHANTRRGGGTDWMAG